MFEDCWLHLECCFVVDGALVSIVVSIEEKEMIDVLRTMRGF
jgi:hypothetical protein